ncbi:MAG: terminase, large subunit [Lokiarchaeia virus VerdaV4]|uniref:Terminase, large subunit n=1 Tax=Lokiarchaeia virus VerdaV4 TaxID=3070172 RepID=A0AA35CNH7_9CAUD|nr:MAG: terminase, large subunit [Lokiarchaeia virus VerdaV4]BDI54961.1 MAG: terminase, large subunit [Lokiarchaeia virus VerdaV4]
MARKSFTPLIKTTLETFPNLKDNYKKLAEKVGCCVKTIKRYFKSLESKVPLDNQSNLFSQEGGSVSPSSITNQDISGIIDIPGNQTLTLDTKPSSKLVSMVGLIENNLNRILRLGTNDARILNTAISFSDKTSKFIIKEESENKGFVDYSIITEKLTDKQLNIFNEMIRDGWVSLLGSRKTGKTFLISSAATYLGSRKNLEIHVLSSKKDTASHIITQVIQIDSEHKFNLFKRPAKEQIIFNNKTRIKVHSNTLADTGTYEADILIIDEAQEVDELVWSKIIPQLASGRKMRVWIFGTAKAGTPFYNFWFGVNPKFKKFELGMEDATWVKEESWSAIKSLMSDRMVRQELRMEWIEPEGAFFRSEDIEAAFEEYPEGFKRDYLEIVCGIDFGLGHETVMGNIAYRKEQIYEIESWGMFNPTSDMIIAKVKEYGNRYSSLFIMEGSPLGGFVRRDVANLRVKFRTSNFSIHKDKYWFALQFLLNNHLIHLKNSKLKQQLLQYDGTKIDDDWVDMLLHAAYYYFNKYYKNNEKWIFNR